LAQIDSELSIVESRSTHHGSRRSPSIMKLEDEIRFLRCKMELTYREESELSAERVIEISRKLDVKINEYMRHKLGCSNR